MGGARASKANGSRNYPAVVLEYEVHAEAAQIGRPYDNRFVSIITVQDRKATHWRDYLDPIAVFGAAVWRDPA